MLGAYGCRAAGYLICALPLMPAAAQEPQDRGEEIVVTARKRAENLQDTPVSLSVFTAQDLERRAASNLTDIAAVTANMRSSGGPQGGSSGHYFIRGIGQLDFIASTDPGVGTYLDGVYLGRTTGAALDLLDVQRVEILRGPQGTLFGRNSIGGAINVISAAPPHEWHRTAAVTLGSRHGYEGRLTLGGPLIEDSLAGQFAALAKRQDGWQHRLIDGGRFGDEETYATRATLLWQGSSRISVLTQLDATHSRGTADPQYLAAANAARAGLSQFVVTDPTTTWAGQKIPDDLDVRGAAITVTYALTNLTLESVTALRGMKSSTGGDFDGTPLPDLDQLVLTRQWQRSEELQLSGTALNGRLSWLAGLFYFDEHVIQNIPLVFYGTPIAQNNDLDNTSYALFSHVTYSLNPWLSFSAGGRITYESKQHAFDHFIDRGAVHEPLFPARKLHDDWTSWTPKLGLEVHIAPQSMLYASISQGFRSGGFNGRPLGTQELLSYAPEKLTTYEIGAKSQWLERRLRLDTAAFYSRYRDIQLTLTTVSPNGLPIVVTGNAGAAELYGMEMDLTAAPTDRLLLEVSAGYLGNRYTQLRPGVAVSQSGRLPVSPRFTGDTALEYRMPVSRNVQARARVEYTYTSAYNYLFDNPALSWQNGYGVWNGRLAFGPETAAWEVAVFVLNATNRRHSSFREDITSSFGTAIVWPARPREAGLQVRVAF